MSLQFIVLPQTALAVALGRRMRRSVWVGTDCRAGLERGYRREASREAWDFSWLLTASPSPSLFTGGRMLWWVPEVLAAVNVFRRWYRVLLGEPLVEWEEWAITEFDCLSVTTVFVWASRSFDHAALLALWLWGLATGVAAVIAAVVGALCVCRWAGRRRVCPVRSSRLSLGNDELCVTEKTLFSLR